MPNSRYQAGARFEREYIKLLKDAGFSCMRSAGSKTPYDICAYKSGDLPLLIQCKIITSEKPWERMRERFLSQTESSSTYIQVLVAKVKGTSKVLQTMKGGIEDV